MFCVTQDAPEMSIPARSSIPPLLANAFCMSTTSTAACAKSISMGSGLLFNFGITSFQLRLPRLNIARFHFASDEFGLAQCQSDNCQRGIRAAGSTQRAAVRYEQVFYFV